MWEELQAVGGRVLLKLFHSNMKNIHLQKNRGFTLVEILIYTAIFVLLVGGITAFTSSLQSSRLRAQIMFEVNDQGNSIVRTISRSIRNAQSINSPTIGDSASSLSLSNINSSIDPVIFSQSDGVLYITEGAGDPIALSNNKVKVTNLTFTNLSRNSTPGVIRFRFTLQNITEAIRPEEQYSVDFYGTAAIR